METIEQESFPQRVLRDMTAAVLVLNRHGYIKYFNRPAARMLELDGAIEPGTVKLDLTVDGSENDAFNRIILDALHVQIYTHTGHVRYRSPSGRLYFVRVSGSFLDYPGDEDDEIVVTISDETREAELRQKIADSSSTFTTFIFSFAIWMLVYALWEYLGRPVAADYMTHGVEVLSMIMLVFILCRTSLTWKDLGLKPEHPLRTLRTAVIVAVCAVGFLFAFKAAARMVNPALFEPDAPFFDVSRFGTRQVLYVLTAGIQEFLARSVMQGNLKRIMIGRHRGAMAIVLSSVIFAALHIHFGFFFMVGAAVLAGLEGILYDKQNNILGVWILHWTFGVCGTLLCLIDH